MNADTVNAETMDVETASETMKADAMETVAGSLPCRHGRSTAGSMETETGKIKVSDIVFDPKYTRGRSGIAAQSISTPIPCKGEPSFLLSFCKRERTSSWMESIDGSPLKSIGKNMKRGKLRQIRIMIVWRIGHCLRMKLRSNITLCQMASP